ncbi:MAG: hypothetical protein ACREXP_10690 [Steroidobacteraceae bacterium]
MALEAKDLTLLGLMSQVFQTGVVYQATGLVRGLKVALLASVIAAAVPGYRFLVFLVTLYFT